MKRVTDKQKIKWFLGGKCHICGSDKPHSHPNYVLMCNPLPDIPENHIKAEHAKITQAIHQASFDRIIIGKVSKKVAVKSVL